MNFLLKKGLFLFFILLIFQNCYVNDKELYNYITKNYTTEDINFFYEYLFNEGKNRICGWNRNIFYEIKGDTLKGDKALVNEVISIFDSLNLPIKLIDSKLDSNKRPDLVIISGTKDFFKFTNDIKDGETKLTYNSKYIISATIKISNEIIGKNRKSLFIHEFEHLLGVSSHISTDLNAILRKGFYPLQTLTKQEKRALKMLYEPIWQGTIEKKQFENLFHKELYHVNGVEKLIFYIKESNINLSVLDSLLLYGFKKRDSLSEPQIYKLTKSLPVFCFGDVPQYVKDSINILINTLNDGAINLNMINITEPISSVNGIFLKFNKVSDSSCNTGISFISKFTKDFQFNIEYLKSIKIFYTKRFSSKWLSFILFQTVVNFNTNNVDQPFIFESDGIKLKEFYKEYLELYYSSYLPHNFKKSEMEEVIRIIKNENN